MNELDNYQAQLPNTLEDLSQFVLVNEERVQALRAQIRAIKKVNLAKEVYEQKLAEAQEIGQITVEAAQKMGELLLQIQKAQGKRKDLTSADNTDEVKTKAQVISDIGLERHMANDYQQMAQNPKAVQAAIQKAIENGDVVSRNQVMKEIRAAKAEMERQLAEKDKIISELEEREPEVVEVEVIPEDYERMKLEHEDYEALKADNKLAWNEQRKMAEKYKEASEKLKELQEREGEAAIQARLEKEADYFSILVTDFVKKIGGYVWISDRVNELPESKKKNFIKAVISIDGWCQQMIKNMGGNISE